MSSTYVTENEVFTGWSLITCSLPGPIGRPSIDADEPSCLCAEIGDDGQLVVTGWDDFAGEINIPIVAISALMAAHAEWVKTQKEKS